MKNLFKVFVMLFVIVAFAACDAATKTDDNATPEGDAVEQTDVEATTPEVTPEEGEVVPEEGDVVTEEGEVAPTDVEAAPEDAPAEDVAPE